MTNANPYNLNDVLVSSWGYDQTNVDFYKVTEVTAKSVVIEAICGVEVSTGSMTARVSPDPELKVLDGHRAFRKRCVAKPSLKINSYRWATLAKIERFEDGRPVYGSYYSSSYA